jgi:hypothetical protein
MAGLAGVATKRVARFSLGKGQRLGIEARVSRRALYRRLTATSGLADPEAIATVSE